ncbi:MAG: mechanosensitive ion channel family protein [Victivallales bacterium]|nr:mechanosensitive ion channel family protein [Victivallales bacterium]
MDPEIKEVGNKLNQITTGIQSQGFWDYTKEFFSTHQNFLYNLGKLIVLCLVVFLLARLACVIVKKLIEKSIQKIGAMDEAIGHVIYNIARTLIWIIAGLIALDLFGFNTASILTVLGAAGLAIGLAMKDSLSNIAAGIMLLILHPYKGGDFIECGSISGVIKELGLFTTTLQTVDGIFVSVPNSVLFGSPIKNYSHNATRRADITVGIAYSDNLAEGLKVLGELLNSNERILKDPAPQVVVSDLADSSVNITLRFWATNQNYWDVYWQVKAQLKGTIEGAGLNIPFPQRVVTFANNPADVRK